MRIRFSFLVFLTVLTGCQSYDPERVEEDFGVSVRQMISEQVYTDADVSPAESGPDRIDGPTAVRTIEQYQNAARKNKRGVASTDSEAQ